MATLTRQALHPASRTEPTQPLTVPRPVHLFMISSLPRWRLLALVAAAGGLSAASLQATAQGRVRNGDYITVIVNQELVTAGEVERRIERAQLEATRGGMKLPPESELRRQVLDSLIDERVIVTSARDSGMRIEEADIDRAVQSVAAQNQISMDVLRQRLRAEGQDYGRFRANLRDQMMMERLREREVYQRIKISDEDIDRVLEQQRAAVSGGADINIAQILVTVPERADEGAVAARRERAEAALARVRGGEAFAAVARDVSEDPNRERGGEIGRRPASRMPDAFVEATRTIQPGQVAPELLRTGAGFHILKLLERSDVAVGRVTQTRARHVLLRTSPQLTAEVASKRLADYRKQIEAGKRSFEDVARQYSEDGSAAAGGDLGWSSPGVMVPEFEEAMNALPVGGISAPVVSRFGVHLIQVLERRETALDAKQLREQARNALREQRFEQAYLDWTKELRSRAYVELREPPQ
jgi:peptidyl-prolyl cis-trans isomerase SurA